MKALSAVSDGRSALTSWHSSVPHMLYSSTDTCDLPLKLTWASAHANPSQILLVMLLMCTD